jgi:hypothetical protein
MIPIDQNITGSRGNCFSACLASLLEIPNVNSVPLFLSEPGDTSHFDWASRLDAWLSQFGLYALHFATPEVPASSFEGALPGSYYILGGRSPRGRPHAVVAKGHEIVHDPHPDKTNLVTVDGWIILVPTWGM